MYTYLITFERYVKCQYGPTPGVWCDGFFRTTDDAVEQHRKVLTEREAEGEIRNVCISPIPSGERS